AATAGRSIVSGAVAKDPALRTPVVAYLVVISAMTVCGWATGRNWVIAGSTLFVISDSLLGWRAFVRERPWMGVAVMVTYHGAIVSLALSLW
ncbi:MAG: lysoplasmalogenase, partial [Ilumatobacteraceae bacterium]|nr:lysoplasmalogenase [Ilumatobacteraceae bacterium]